MPGINRPLRSFNAEAVKLLYIEDANGQPFHLRRRLAGDISLVEPKLEAVPVTVDGKTVQALSGNVSMGSLTIPLHGEALTDVEESGDPTLHEVLSGRNNGSSWDPFTNVSGTDPDGDAFEFQAPPRLKMWKFVIESVYSRVGNNAATKNERVTIYAMVPTPDISIAQVGAVSSYTINGTIPREGMVTISTI